MGSSIRFTVGTYRQNGEVLIVEPPARLRYTVATTRPDEDAVDQVTMTYAPRPATAAPS